jgi:hypothetical protein
MRRRTLLTVGLLAGTLLAVAGGARGLLRPAWQNGRLSETGRAILAAVVPAILDGLVPAAPEERLRVVSAQLLRLEATINGLPIPLQDEVNEMLTVLGSAAGRLALTGLRSPWADASDAEVAAALQGLQVSTLALRQQIFHALRDLTNAAHFADPVSWPAIGYPGPRPL